MATYLPIRALNRSSAVRINGQKVSATTTSYVDISLATVRKEVQFHTSIGQVYVVGGLTGSNATYVFTTSGGGKTAQNTGSDLKVTVAAGDFRNRDTGVLTALVVSGSPYTIAAADVTNPRIDIVVADATSGVVSVVTGTPAAAPVAPAVPTGKFLLATVAVAANATAVVNANVTDNRSF